MSSWRTSASCPLCLTLWVRAGPAGEQGASLPCRFHSVWDVCREVGHTLALPLSLWSGGGHRGTDGYGESGQAVEGPTPSYKQPVKSPEMGWREVGCLGSQKVPR